MSAATRRLALAQHIHIKALITSAFRSKTLTPYAPSSNLRVRPNILRYACVPYNSAQHEPDHCENDETDVAAGEVLVVLGETAATAHPTVGALNDPSLGEHMEALGGVRALDDLEWDAGHLLHLVGRRLALVAAVGDCVFE